MTNLKLKRISLDSIDVALDKAKHYRLLNEPMHAESICLDVLEVDANNQRAIVTLLLSLTDQFSMRQHDAFENAKNLIPQLVSDYDKHYYEGIIYERWAITQIQYTTAMRSVPGWLVKAMQCFELAEKHSESENPDPILRWNTCARQHAKVRLSDTAPVALTRDIHSEFGDDVPPR